MDGWLNRWIDTSWEIGHLAHCIDCLLYSKLIGGKSPGSRMFQALRIVKVAKLKSTDGRDCSATLNGNKAGLGGGFSRRTVWL